MDFLPSTSVFAAFTLASLVLAITPGPDMTLAIGRTISGGRGAGIAAVMGTATGCLIHTLAAVAGVSVLLAASPSAFWALKIVGAAYLLWLAVQALLKGSAFRLEKSDRKKTSFLNHYMTGIGINIFNPKVVLFYITFLPQFVSASDPDAWKKMLTLGIYFVLFSTPVAILAVLMADRLTATLLRKPKLTRMIDWLFATVFAGFAVRILLTESR